MKDQYDIKGHVTSSGIVVSDEPVKMKPGPVEITVRSVAEKTAYDEIVKWGKTPYTDKENALFQKHLERIWAIPCDESTKPKYSNAIDDAVYGDIKPLKSKKKRKR